MIDNLRDRLAWRRALKMVRRRQPKAWTSAPTERRVLLIVPAGTEESRAAWRFVDRLNLDPERTLPIVPTGDIAYAPVEFLGRVRVVNRSDFGRLGLPRKSLVAEIRGFEPDVAMYLNPEFHLSYAILVGASMAAFRIGFQAESADAFFDLMVDGKDPGSGFRALDQALARITPPIIVSSPPQAAGGGRPAW